MDRHIVYLATYPPRRCGIAAFTQDLRAAVGGDGRVLALGPTDGTRPDRTGLEPPEVVAFLDDHGPADYRRAAVAIDGLGADVVSLQHEFGIYGGADGEHVLELADRLRTPIVPTLHTVLARPSERQRAIVRGLASRSAALVVMSEMAASLLARTYGVDPDRVRVIPHGVPDVPRVDPAVRKRELGLGHRPAILSFGLIGPGKGYELAIEALPRVVRSFPDALYLIVGTTHPDLLHREGERYRDGLRRRATGLGLDGSVRFEDRFLGRAELLRWLQAADVFVTPYPNLDQIVSGTLSYAMGAGLAIVSTPYLYAREVLAGNHGVLVPPGSPSSLGTVLVELLRDRERRAALAARAYARGRTMIWPTVGRAYRELFDEVTHAAVPAGRAIPSGAETARVG